MFTCMTCMLMFMISVMDSILASLSSVLTFGMLKDNRILKCYLERNLWKHKLPLILFWVKINALEQCLLLVYQFLLLLTFSLSTYVDDENSQNFHDGYTGWSTADGNISLIQGKKKTYWECQEKGGRVLWVNYKVFSGVEHKYSFCSETYIDRKQTGLRIPGHIPWKWNGFISKELCNWFPNV